MRWTDGEAALGDVRDADACGDLVMLFLRRLSDEII